MNDTALRVVVIGNLPPHVLGGAENQVSRLVQAWLEQGHAVEVIGHRIPDATQMLGTRVVRTHHIHIPDKASRLRRAIAYARSLTRFLVARRRDFDVVYCRAMADGAVTVVCLKALGLVRWPLVICPINAGRAGDVAFVRSIPGSSVLLRLIDRQCNAFNLIAPAMDADLDAARLHHPLRSRIPNGIGIGAAKRQHAPARVRRLCWTGRLAAQKGIDVLIEALGRLHRQGREFALTLIGDGPDRDALRTRCDVLGLHDHVVFAEAVSAVDVRQLLAQFDVFVLPSRYEGMSNSALEAMEASLPVLCTRCGGIDEYVALGAGWTCEADSIDALEAALRAMLDASDADLIARGAQGRHLVELHFDIASVAARNISLMRSLVR